MKASDVKIGETYRVCREGDPLFDQLVVVRGQHGGGRFKAEVLGDAALRSTWNVHPDALEPISPATNIEVATIEEIMAFLGV